MNFKVLLFLILFPFFTLSQTTKVEGTVTDAITGEVMPFVTVRFQNAKVGAITDTLGKYSIETYYATDSLVFSFSGYLKVTTYVELDKAQVIDVMLPILTANYEEVVVKAPDEFPSTILHKKVITNKPINNKEKLEAYEYEVYNKIQLDINNINDKFGPVSSFATKYYLFVLFDRWGNIIFETNDVLEGWNGGDSVDGIYYWSIDYEGIKGQKGTQKGYVLLVK